MKDKTGKTIKEGDLVIWDNYTDLSKYDNYKAVVKSNSKELYTDSPFPNAYRPINAKSSKDLRVV